MNVSCHWEKVSEIDNFQHSFACQKETGLLARLSRTNPLRYVQTISVVNVFILLTREIL